jgi:hypothetical protein
MNEGGIKKVQEFLAPLKKPSSFLQIISLTFWAMLNWWTLYTPLLSFQYI